MSGSDETATSSSGLQPSPRSRVDSKTSCGRESSTRSWGPLPGDTGQGHHEHRQLLLEGEDWISDLLEDMPSLAVDRALRRQTLKNGSRPWSVNDQRDLDHLSISVPYCDIVVTEKHAVGRPQACRSRSQVGHHAVDRPLRLGGDHRFLMYPPIEEVQTTIPTRTFLELTAST